MFAYVWSLILLVRVCKKIQLQYCSALGFVKIGVSNVFCMFLNFENPLGNGWAMPLFGALYYWVGRDKSVWKKFTLKIGKGVSNVVYIKELVRVCQM